MRDRRLTHILFFSFRFGQFQFFLATTPTLFKKGSNELTGNIPTELNAMLALTDLRICKYPFF